MNASRWTALMGFVFALGVAMTTHAQTDEVWVRIDRPSPELRRELPPEALDYGSFVWMPERSLPDTARSQSLIHRHRQPFAIPMAGQAVDLTQLPAAGASRSANTEPGLHLIQFRGPVRSIWLEELAARGLEPIQFIAPNAYLVWGQEDQLPSPSTRRQSEVRFAGPIPEAARAMSDRKQAEPHDHARAMVYGPAADQALKALREADVAVLDFRAVGGDFLVVNIKARPEQFAELLGIPGVLTVQQVTQDAGPRGELANQSVVSLDGPNQTLIPGYQDWLNSVDLDGTGVTVAVVDAGIRETHQDLVGQFVVCQPGDDRPTSCSQALDDHGTHVAGAIVGSGASGTVDDAGFLRGLGIAPGARVVQQRYPPLLSAGPNGMVPGGMLTIFAESALSGAVLANNSWGPSDTPQGYDIPTREVDLITRNALPEATNPAPILPVWSVMNGEGDDPGSVCAPSSLGAPDEAKNVLSVGSSKLQFGNGTQRPDLFDISSNSAHGPACDGRRVPQIIAPGCATDNPIASSDSAYSSSFCGTSMASPIVTGAAALFVEQYRRDHDGRTPSPALIRARMTASARNLAGFLDADGMTLGHRPDRKQGWGRLDANAVLAPALPVFMLDQTRLFSETGQAWTGRLQAADPAEPMQMMLAWTDAPGHGLGGDLPAWVNNLDLIVNVGTGVYYGNGIGGDGYSALAATPDPSNNLEGVVLAPAQHGGGPVRIEVLAANLAADALDPWNPTSPGQDFALVCINCQAAPDYTLSVTPQAIKACLDDGPLDAQVTVRSVLGFSEPVGLSALGLNGFSAGITLDSSALAPSYERTLSVATNNVNAGDYEIVVQGSAPEAGTISSILRLELDGTLATAATAISPAPGSITSPATGFAWTALADADQYRFELATDAAFANIVESRLTETPTWQPERWLAPDTDYFWRMRGINSCGEGVLSSTFSATTTPGPAAALAFVTPPDPDGQGGFLSPVQVEILNSQGNRIDSDDQSLIELSLVDPPAGTVLGGTLQRQVSAGMASFDDLTIVSDFDGDFVLQASLNADEVLDVGSFELNTRDPVVRQVAAGLSSLSSVVGIAFSGTVTGITTSPSFASDLRLVVSSPNNETASLGGFTSASDEPWDFNGDASGQDGAYSSDHPTLFASPVADEGFWRFEFRNDFPGGLAMRWDDVQVTLIKQPIQVANGPVPIQGSRIFNDRFELN